MATGMGIITAAGRRKKNEVLRDKIWRFRELRL
jgi:hypothetical protein